MNITLENKQCLMAGDGLLPVKMAQAAKENGFDRTYIPSEHVGLYEKYGYYYLKDIVNYGNGKDRLYVKEIK